MTVTIGGPEVVLADAVVDRFVTEQLAGLDLDGRSLCLVIPDATRQCPLPTLLGAITRAVFTLPRVSSTTSTVTSASRPWAFKVSG